MRTIAAGRDPESFDITPDGRQLYVSNEETSAVSVVDIPSGRFVRTIDVGAEPEGVTVSPDGKLVYVTSESENAVDVISTVEQRVVARLPTSARPRAVALSADGSQAYVTAELGGKLHMIDTRSRAPNGDVRTGGPDAKPMGIAVAPDGVLAYVANGRAGSVAVIDLPSRRATRTIEHVGARPWGIALTPNGKKLYVAAGPDVAVLDPARGTVVKRIAVGKGRGRRRRQEGTSSRHALRFALGMAAALLVVGCRKRVDVAAKPSRQGLAGATGVTTTTGASADEDGQWTMPAKDYANTRFSKLARITTANVKDLRLAWSYKTGLVRGHEAAPIVVGESMFVTTPYQFLATLGAVLGAFFIFLILAFEVPTSLLSPEH